MPLIIECVEGHTLNLNAHLSWEFARAKNDGANPESVFPRMAKSWASFADFYNRHNQMIGDERRLLLRHDHDSLVLEVGIVPDGGDQQIFVQRLLYIGITYQPRTIDFSFEVKREDAKPEDFNQVYGVSCGALEQMREMCLAQVMAVTDADDTLFKTLRQPEQRIAQRMLTVKRSLE